ncbi:hypothetical protein [Yoonia sp. SS1-5]|uniref:Uncharacterized protein n=1 Tax=Yoonia rhodophyticola TaxID=3137370 RepID=A0AAN0NKK6_9RHOB
MKRFAALLLCILVTLGCASQRSPEELQALREMGPRDVGVRSPSNGDRILASLRPFTQSGTVQTLQLEMRIPREWSGKSADVQIADGDYRALREAISRETAVDLATGLRIGQAIARHTFCRSGPVALNTGMTRWSAGHPRDARTAIPPVRFEDRFQPSIIVSLTCDATNPYMSAEKLAQARRPAPTVAEFRAMTVGRTSLSFSQQHGTQIVYIAPNGASYLWYPGNPRVVVGKWRITPPRAPAPYPLICFDYGTPSVDIITGTRGTERCMSPGNYLGLEKEARNGDLFGLAVAGIPFVLTNDQRYSMAALLGRSR